MPTLRGAKPGATVAANHSCSQLQMLSNLSACCQEGRLEVLGQYVEARLPCSLVVGSFCQARVVSTSITFSVLAMFDCLDRFSHR